MFFCCIYPPHLKGQSLKLLSDIKLVHGAKKFGDHKDFLKIEKSKNARMLLTSLEVEIPEETCPIQTDS